MKFFSVNKIVDELKLLLDIPFETIALIMNGEDMYNDNYNHSQGSPCLVKISSKKKGDKLYKYHELRDLFEDDFAISINLPRKFNKEYLACMIDITNPQTSDKFEGTYYARKFAKLSPQVLKMAQEEQKYINEQIGIVDELFAI